MIGKESEMTKAEALNLVEESLEMETNTLTGEEEIADLDGWDSMAVISLIALVDETFNITLEPEEIMESVIVNDLLKLIDDSLV